MRRPGKPETGRASTPAPGPRLAEAMETARTRRAAAERAFEIAEERERADFEAREQLAALEADSRLLANRLPTVRAREREAISAAVVAEKRLAALQRAHAAADAAHGLERGGRMPGLPARASRRLGTPFEPGLDGARKDAEKTEKAAQRASETSRELASGRLNLRVRTDEARSRAAGAAQRLEEALEGLSREITPAGESPADGFPAEGFPARTTVLAPLDAALSEASRALDAHDRESRGLDAQARRDERRAGDSQAAAAAAATLAHRARRAADDAVKTPRRGGAVDAPRVSPRRPKRPAVRTLRRTSRSTRSSPPWTRAPMKPKRARRS